MIVAVQNVSTIEMVVATSDSKNCCIIDCPLIGLTFFGSLLLFSMFIFKIYVAKI